MDAVLSRVDITQPDGASVVFVPQVGPPVPGPGLPEAPVDGNTYGRRDATWIAVGGANGAVVFAQASPAMTWTMNHNLGFRPAVTLFDPGGNQFDAEVAHPSVNQTIVSLAVATAGSARLQ